jgi:hypothetical protein
MCYCPVQQPDGGLLEYQIGASFLPGWAMNMHGSMLKPDAALILMHCLKGMLPLAEIPHQYLPRVLKSFSTLTPLFLPRFPS